jgi:transketolase
VDEKRVEELRAVCREIRWLTLDAIGRLGMGHIGGSLSVVEILALLYFEHMRVDPQKPRMEGRDRFVLSKGHAGPGLYATLVARGYFDRKVLHTLNQPHTTLPSHADMNRTPGVDMTAGSLGQGFSCAVGIAVGAKWAGDGARVYAAIGDGESDEGLIWEAAMLAAHRKLDNLIAFTDYNKMQLDGKVSDVMGLEPLADKWRAFGWEVWETDGHDIAALDKAIRAAKAARGKPCMIIAHTVKGKGVSFIEAAWKNNHYVPMSPQERVMALEELGGETAYV